MKSLVSRMLNTRMGNEVGRERNHFSMSCEFFFFEEEKLNWFSVLPWRRRRGKLGL